MASLFGQEISQNICLINPNITPNSHNSILISIDSVNTKFCFYKSKVIILNSFNTLDKSYRDTVIINSDEPRNILILGKLYKVVLGYGDKGKGVLIFENSDKSFDYRIFRLGYNLQNKKYMIEFLCKDKSEIFKGNW
ncbi:MAG: hypothetical protein ABI207_02965 [Crocinitomicaceae bacterium]